MKRIRRFDGKAYRLFATAYESSLAAHKRASRLRLSGVRARVVEYMTVYGAHYAIYVRDVGG